jgi:hypothetical protein
LGKIALMKTLLFLLMSILLQAEAKFPLDFERGIMQKKRDACAMAKALAYQNYKVEEMNGCTCEKIDGREWLCDAYFRYSKKFEKENN